MIPIVEGGDLVSFCNMCGKDIEDGRDYCEECGQHQFINDESMNEDKTDLDNKDNIFLNNMDDEIIDKELNNELDDILSLDDLEMDDDLQEGIEKFLVLQDENENTEEEMESMEDMDSDEDSESDINFMDLLSNDDLMFHNDTHENNDVTLHDEQVEEEEDFFTSIMNHKDEEDTFSEKESSPNTMSDIFADVLSAVSELEDPDVYEVSESDNEKYIETPIPNSVDRSKRKKIAFSKIFENVHDEKSKEKVRKEQEYEETQKLKAEKKKEKAVAKKESKKQKKEDQKLAKTQKVKAKEEAKAKKKALKAEKASQVQEIEFEAPEDPGRINLVGATFVLSTFAVLAMIILIGTNIYSYSLSIKNATRKFDKGNYVDAYEEVYGLDIKDDDIELYDKIMTVMYVEKQLNSYNNYMSLEKYPEALDSLLKGLKRYDKYIELAKELEIETDLDFVRGQILTELKRKFNLGEKKAMNIIALEDQTRYSITVYEIVMESMDQLVSK